MNYKPSPLQVKLGECVWGRRAVWEVNKMLSGWVYSKVLQLKYLRLDGSKTKPPSKSLALPGTLCLARQRRQ